MRNRSGPVVDPKEAVCTLLPRRAKGSLIEQKPIHSKVFYCFVKTLEFHRLSDKTIGSALVAVHYILFLARCGEYHHRNVLSLGIGPDLAQYFEAYYFRKLQVQENQPGIGAGASVGVCALSEQIIEGFLTVSDYIDAVLDVVVPEGEKGKFLVVGVVFDEKDSRIFLLSVCHR
jgi:hypothetical protein